MYYYTLYIFSKLNEPIKMLPSSEISTVMESKLPTQVGVILMPQLVSEIAHTP
ncbi:hypothetical protein FHS14_005880 [Paenibacillus baekrokdamisoli]|nr:hypothetical protein [Paenibacillus baekrokdamisoli]